MTVAELIAALAGMPPDAPVVLNLGRNEFANGLAAARAELLLGHRDNRSGVCGEWYNTGEWNYDPECDTPPTPIVNLTPS